MRLHPASVSEIRLLAGQPAAWIACPPSAVPAPGRYVSAWSPEDADAPLGTPLFAAETSPVGFLAVSPLPRPWEPGACLQLRGPLGRGFALPSATRRLALAALGETAVRLIPLLRTALAGGASLALFTDLPLPSLPADVEISPLSTLPEALSWADFLALDVPLQALSRLEGVLGIPAGGHPLPCPAQALVLADMPCAGSGECGACAVLVGRKWKLACTDGPVFDLRELLR
jgi:NAD(P)H-flavin reductase